MKKNTLINKWVKKEYYVQLYLIKTKKYLFSLCFNWWFKVFERLRSSSPSSSIPRWCCCWVHNRQNDRMCIFVVCVSQFHHLLSITAQHSTAMNWIELNWIVSRNVELIVVVNSKLENRVRIDGVITPLTTTTPLPLISCCDSFASHNNNNSTSTNSTVRFGSVE